MNALAAAAHLVRQGVPFRNAHEMVGKAVQAVRREGLRDCSSCPREELAHCGIQADDGVLSLL